MGNSALFRHDVTTLRKFLKDFIAFSDYEPNETALSDKRVGEILKAETLHRAGASAGAAAAAFTRHGRSGSEVLAEWQRGVDWDDSWEVRLAVIADIAHAIGAAEDALSIAEAEERTFTGRLARALRWPRDLADLVGGTRGQKTAARAVGYVGQIAVVVVGGLILWVLTLFIQSWLSTR